MFEIVFKKSVFKDLKRIDEAVLKRIFDKLENDLLKRPVLETRVSHRKEAYD